MSQPEMRRRTLAPASPIVRVVVAFVAPLLLALLIASLAPAGAASGQNTAIPFLAGLGLTSWLLGLLWYGLPALGLRGGRPLYAGIGFSALAWTAFIVLRFAMLRVLGFGSAASGQAFVYLLLFEAFAVQLWVFGLLFRGVADWRGAMTAAVSSGILFGAVGILTFRESFDYTSTAGGAGSLSLLAAGYFVTWGILYGVIRLRSGSLLGTTLVQALQSFTAWVVMVAEPVPAPGQLRLLYLVSIVVYLLLIWRLWPSRLDDYRV